jgi:hypothetical protein
MYFNRLRDKRNWIAEYSRIKASFSHELLLMLKSDNFNQENTKSYPFTVKNTIYREKNRSQILSPLMSANIYQ